MLPFCGGDEFTVGVLWDYCSLPQPERSPLIMEMRRGKRSRLIPTAAVIQGLCLVPGPIIQKIAKQQNSGEDKTRACD